MTVTKTQLAEAYAATLTKQLGDAWGRKFSRRDASRLMEGLWPVISDLALKDTNKEKPGSVPLGHLGRFKMRYKAATKSRKGVNPFTGEPMVFKAKPARKVVKVLALKNLKEMV